MQGRHDHSRLQLEYLLDSGRTIARHTHSGTLRILKSLYPEETGICHNVLVHPPSGLVGGDVMEIDVHVQSGAHGLVTTPGATRFYRSDTELAVQKTTIHIAEGARLQWCPMETICYSGCRGENHMSIQLQDGAEMMGWDVVSLGLPLANLPFLKGSYLQHLQIRNIWMERGLLDAGDRRLMDGPLGLNSQRCMALAYFAVGSSMDRTRREEALDAVRDVLRRSPLAATAGATSPNPHVVVVRVLSALVEPAMQLMREVRKSWLIRLWNQHSQDERIWSM